MSEVETPRLTEEAIQQIKARAKLARVSTVSDTLGERAANHVIEHDVPALCDEVETLQADLQTALGALADIANMTEGEIADGVAQRKAKRIYNEVRGRKPDTPVD